MIGILDLQGGVIEHLTHLRRLGVEGCRVKAPRDLSGLSGLILPGGESTCLSRLMTHFGLNDVIIRECRRGMKIWGTCAGAILLASSIIGERPYLSLLDMEVERNGFGGQLDSFYSEAMIPRVSSRPIPLTFIRAPKILSVGREAAILVKIEDTIAATETAGAMATIFHPELTDDLSFHRYFLRKCGIEGHIRIA